MVAFENQHLANWRSTIEEAKSGLKVFLMSKNEDKNGFEINSDQRLTQFLNNLN